VFNEILDGLSRSLDLDGDSGGGIANRAAKMSAGCETIDVGTESDSLHNAGDFDLASNLHTPLAYSLACGFVCAPSLLQPHHPFVQAVAGQAGDFTISIPGCTLRAFSAAALISNGT
jgi:hypothetical protein